MDQTVDALIHTIEFAIQTDATMCGAVASLTDSHTDPENATCPSCQESWQDRIRSLPPGSIPARPLMTLQGRMVFRVQHPPELLEEGLTVTAVAKSGAHWPVRITNRLAATPTSATYEGADLRRRAG